MKIGIVVMNRDRPDLTNQVVEQIQAMGRGIETTLVVVEAGSDPDSGESKYATHRFEDSPYRGRYHAFNKGLEFLHQDFPINFDYYWFVCNDVIFKEGQDALAELVQCMEGDSRMGLIGPSESNQEWYPGAASQGNSLWHKTATVHGLAQLFRGEVIRTIGYMNPCFHYSQGAGTELAYKLYSNGWFLAVSDGVSLTHAEGSTYGSVVPISRHEYQRRANLFATRYLRKHYGSDWDKLFSSVLPEGVDGSAYTWQKEVWERRLNKEKNYIWYWRAGSLLKGHLRRIFSKGNL